MDKDGPKSYTEKKNLYREIFVSIGTKFHVKMLMDKSKICKKKYFDKAHI